MKNKRNIVLIALLFAAVLSVCIFVSLHESGAPAGNQSNPVVSRSDNKVFSSTVLSSAGISSQTSSTASSVNNKDVEKFLNNFKQENNQYRFFDFALSTCDFSDNMIEAAVSFYSDKQNPQPAILIMSKYGIKNISLVDNATDDAGPFVFANNGKITITGQNDLTVAIQNIKTKAIYDCYLNYKCSNQGRTSAWSFGWNKRGK